MTAFSADPLADLREMVRYPFMVHALLAGSVLALLAGSVGWYVVLRRQSFTAHTLALMSFPGGAGAALAGLPLTLGLYLATGAGALILGAGRRVTREATVGVVQSAALAAGILLLALNATLVTGPESLLFGTFLGITAGQVLALVLVSGGALLALAAVGRPLLLASVDPELAAARGVPVRRLETGFLLLVAVAVAAAGQITGALLVFTLLVVPPAAARMLTARPLPGLLLSVGLALFVVWLALAAAYFSSLPVGFLLSACSLGVLAGCRALRWRR